MRKRLQISSAGILLAAMLSGCGNGGTATEPAAAGEGGPPEPAEPVTLKMYQTQSYWSEDDFNALIAEPVKKKYPNITVEFERSTKIEQALANGDPIDLIAVWNGLMPQYEDMGLFEDISPLVQKMRMDLSRFDPGALEAVKRANKAGKLYGLPNLIQFNALYYNKDIFDKFGVSYPSDGMTWDDTIELARKVTRKDGDTQYLGLDPDYLTRMLVPLSLGIVDGTNDKTDVNSEPYKRVFELTKKIYEIPGNRPPGKVMGGSVADRFMKDKNLAMMTTINRLDALQNVQDLNWDVAQFPSYPDRPNLYGAYDMHIMAISSISQHKEDAFRVLQVLFSDEVQLLGSNRGKLPAMKDPKFNQAFLKGVDSLKDKHIQSIFKSKPAPAAPPYSVYYSKARGILVDRFRDYVDGKMDVNSALRQAEEEINQYIATEKPSK
jgi:multiple sugar transport system substrate-binding protein